MKIRTDFVTNSSSYCSTEIIIDNPVLLEILQKYKDMGLFGENDPIIGIGTYESEDENFWKNGYVEYTKTPAFFYYEHQNDEGLKSLFLVVFSCPKTLDKVLEYIIAVLNDCDKYLDMETLTLLKEELNQREEEIINAYSSVFWKSSGYGMGEYYEKFEYDPKNGEIYLDKDPDSEEENEDFEENNRDAEE